MKMVLMTSVVLTLSLMDCALAQGTQNQGVTQGMRDSLQTTRNFSAYQTANPPFRKYDFSLLTSDSHSPSGILVGQCLRQARWMLHELASQDYKGALKSFSPSAQSQVTPEHLARMWTSLESSYGKWSSFSHQPLIGVGGGGQAVVAISMKYQRANLTANVMCDGNNKVTDFKVTQQQEVAAR